MKQNSLLKDFSYRLRKYRESSGYSQKKMAACFGATQANYSRYEKAIIFPNFSRLHHFAITTGISPDWLVCSKGAMYHKDKPEEKEEKEVKKVFAEKEKDRAEPVGEISDTEIKDLLHHMERIPLLRHQILASFYTFKEERKEMVAAAFGDVP
jgi:transcriptional regulator with XRE-family HTH domain